MIDQRAADESRAAPTFREGFSWVEFIKATALLWIFVNHVAEHIFGEAYMANPAVGWPALSSRIAQLRPLTGHGLVDIPLNIVRYLGWCGDQGVQLFLIISGFGITWGMLSRGAGASPSLAQFYLRRAERIYPMWWACHLLFLVSSLVLGGIITLRSPLFYESLIGFRMTPQSLYYFAPAWWYVGLIIQLYIVYPLLWSGLRVLGPWRFLGLSCAAAFLLRGAGLLYFDQYLDAWSRGAIFITRLPEFAIGMCLAVWMRQDSQRLDGTLRRPAAVALALALYPVGIALSLTLMGMTVAPFLLGVSVFVVLYAFFALPFFARPRVAAPFNWIGQHSYSLYLVHGTMVRMWCPEGARGGFLDAAVRVTIALLCTLALAGVLEWSVSGAVVRLRVLRRQWGTALFGGCAAALAALAICGLKAGDIAVARYNPQEVRGWGEKASLEPHPVFGWRLKPSTTTRLRWESYDYTVTANSLGFPGPEYPQEKAPGVFRILAIGDAFTSAEGVDTDQSWPRLLERKLQGAGPERTIQVMNFAITGYGPEQAVAVAETFVPKYHPNLILYGFFVNEYFDALENNEQFCASIGFDRPKAIGWKSIVYLDQLRTYLSNSIGDPLRAVMHGPSKSHGYLLGEFAALERGRSEVVDTGRALVAKHLQRLKETADRAGARVLVIMIPASAQVCSPSNLAYYPWGVDLSDATKYDVDQPQRVTSELAKSLQIPTIDLRSMLKDARAGHPYQRYNMHWTTFGHERVAAYLSERLAADGYIKEP